MSDQPKTPLEAGAVAARAVCKVYRLYDRPSDRLRSWLGLGGEFIEHQALAGVDLSIAPGEAVAIIGENGAGKSTLLKLIAGTTGPSSGEIEVAGRISSILELGVGFHPDLSGRANAALYAEIMGLPGSSMAEALEAAAEFAELGTFLDHPIRTYSTGMVMRLAFAVATHVEADLLVVDEALAVGDGAFQKRCIDRMTAIRDAGTTVLFCTHAMYSVTQFCSRAIWLDAGKVVADGPANEVVEAYESFLVQRAKRHIEDGETSPQAREVRITGVELDQVPKTAGESLKLHFGLDSLIDSAVHVAVAVDSLDGRCIWGASTQHDGLQAIRGRGRHRVELEIPSLPLARGGYDLSVFALDESGLHVHDQVVLPRALELKPSARWSPSLLRLEHHWQTRSE